MPLTTPLVSVIIPCYNVSAYVAKAIKSIIDQTYHNLEIWIIDDASTDDTLSKINSIKDDRIKLVAFRENTQKVGAVNEVLQKVTGDYIAFQDADDWSEPARIELQLKEFVKDIELGICFTNYKYMGSKTFLPEKISLNNEELRDEFLNFSYKKGTGKSPTNCPTMMISKQALQKTKGYSPEFAGRVGEDIQWIYRILKFYKGVTIDKVLYNYTLRNSSLTGIQHTGLKPKYAYSWQLLTLIIDKDINDGLDILSEENRELFKKMELEACEVALSENIQLLNHTRQLYESSTNFKIGKAILAPFRILGIINHSKKKTN